MAVLHPGNISRRRCSWCSRAQSVARRFRLPIGPKILLDLRETGVRRGYHLLAAATLMAPYLEGCRLYAISNDHPEEHIAMNVFRFDTGCELVSWKPVKRRFWPRPKFDLYLAICDDWPTDLLTRKLRRRCRLFLLGLQFPAIAQDSEALVMNGNDTRAYAAKALELLGRSLGAPH